jgi:hypothetical protein
MGIYDNLLIRDIADRLKVSGSTMVPKYFGDVKEVLLNILLVN